MKKYRLKSWVKEALYIMFVIVILIALTGIIYSMTNAAIRDCVNGGHSEEYCKSELAR